MKMKITEVRIRLANEDLVKAYVTICFDNCFMVGEITVIKGRTGLFISFPNRTQSEAVSGILHFRSTLKRGT